MSGDSEAEREAQRSHLFMVRLWPEDVGSGETDWRGKVQHVNSGEARYFRDWPTLEAFVDGLLHRREPGGPRPGGNEEAASTPRGALSSEVQDEPGS